MVRGKYKRSDRVGDVVKRGIAEILIRGELGVDFGFVTVTKIEMSNDLKNAKVFISIHGDEEEKKKQFKKLMDNKKRMRYLVAQNINLRYTPALKLYRDDSLDNSIKVQQLLNDIEHGAN
ncbi:MAG: 30S ribosome-binding factor RbfA [Candidatus Marinimicrobia bacterium]|nr:30S ribosome-binding factor RbfA [Candidatus Neomarinimicrobiota bacterium]